MNMIQFDYTFGFSRQCKLPCNLNDGTENGVIAGGVQLMVLAK